MGTQKPGPPTSGSLANFPFNDGFRISSSHKNNLSKFYELDLKILFFHYLFNQSSCNFVFMAVDIFGSNFLQVLFLTLIH